MIGIPSLIMGAKSCYDNGSAGTYGSAAVDAVGMVADAGAIALPMVPGGVGIGIKATRATIAAAQKVDKVATLVKGVEATVDAAESGDVVGAVKSGASVAMGAKASLPGGKSAQLAQEETKALTQNAGRSGKQGRLRELGDDPNVSAADRGWIKNEQRHIETGNRDTIRNPPGKDLAHERGREAAKGYSYEHSNLQDRDLHRTQHKYDNGGRANKERPVEKKADDEN